MAIASFVLGLLSILLCLNLFTGIPALILGILALSSIKQDNLGGRGMAITGIILGAVGTLLMPIVAVLIGMLLPAVMAARDGALNAATQNNLKQISNAVHNHEADNNTYPAAASGEAPNQMSWRIQLALYMEGADIAEQYQKDQPWDSAANLELVPMIPHTLQDPGGPSPPSGNTNYLALVGEDTAFPPGGRQSSTSQMRDGASNTILFVEVDDEFAVLWTQPQDLDFDPESPMTGLGNKRRGYFNAAFADGHVQTISSDIDPEVLRAMSTPAGGEPFMAE